MGEASTIGWGVWGAGLTAQRFARDLSQVSGARLVAVASRTAAKAQVMAQAMGAPLGVEGLDGLLALPQVEVVYIATPNHRHKDDCLAALAAGRHVLCEKPLAMSEADAREIAQAAQKAGRFCMEGLWTQFIPAIAETERLLAAGAIGTPATFLASFGLPTRDTADLAPLADGGALLDRGCYLISLALRFFGEVTSVSGGIVGRPGADLSAAMTLTFKGGRTAMLSASLVDQLENRLFVGGTQGSIALDDVTCPIGLRLTTSGPSPAPGGLDLGFKGRLREGLRRAVRQSAPLSRLRALASDRPRLLPCRGFGFTHEIDEVQACLRDGLLQSPTHPLSRSIETLRIIEAVSRGDARPAGG